MATDTHHSRDDHAHDHAHGHDRAPDEADRLSYYQRMEVAVRELLIAKGIIGADDVRRAVEAMDARAS